MRFTSLITCLCALFIIKGDACTDFVVTSADGCVVNGRSLEFGLDLKSQIVVRPRNERIVSKASDGTAGLQWISKYGFISVAAFGTDIVFDGLNEKGLSLGALWLPGTEYQVPPSGESAKALDFIDVGKWILGNFSSVAELKKSLKGIYVWGHAIPELPMVAPLHLAVHDSQGNNLVIEFIKGEMKIYDNPIGVLTNYPPFDWQMTNLSNYINLTALNSNSLKFKGVTIPPTGEGSGTLGMPGDWTPPSRFVRLMTLTRFVLQPADAFSAVNLSEHLLNTVDIPMGAIQRTSQEKTGADYTQWIVIKDLKNKVFYFRSYEDLALKGVDLTKVNLGPSGKVTALAIDTEVGYIDVTDVLRPVAASNGMSK